MSSVSFKGVRVLYLCLYIFETGTSLCVPCRGAHTGVCKAERHYGRKIANFRRRAVYGRFLRIGDVDLESKVDGEGCKFVRLLKQKLVPTCIKGSKATSQPGGKVKALRRLGTFRGRLGLELPENKV
jgi:hypothetical protein